MQQVPYILSQLTEDDVGWLLLSGEHRTVPAGTVLIAEGQPTEALYIILSGVICVSNAASDGQQIDRLGAGEILGEVSLADGRPPAATLTAESEVLVFAIPRERLVAKLSLDTGFAARFYRVTTTFLADRLRLMGRLVDIADWSESAAADEEEPPQFLANVHLAAARFELLLHRLQQPAALTLTGNDLTIDDVARVASDPTLVEVSSLAWQRMERARALVQDLAAGPNPIYGVTTGLGALKEVRIAPDQMDQFQQNILLSHAAGVGPEYSSAVVRAIMVTRLNGLARGGAGIQPAVFQLLLALLNAGIHPIVPSRGSVGMSDLTQLAHLALPLIGLGEVEYLGERLPAGEALARVGLQPAHLGAKDALALCSANSASVGHGALVLAASLNLLVCADITAALSLEAFGGNVSLLGESTHSVRPHSGQLAAAERMRLLLAGSSLWGETPARSIQDPLSLRCVTQVHGACQEALSFVRGTVETELNATGDNPLVLPEEGRIISTGNFHSAGVALGFDLVAMALAQVSSLTASRVLRLMDPHASGLPPQLTPHPGLNSGLGMLQKTLVALNAETRFLAAPASLDFMAVAGDVEDHATMATRTVSKAEQIVTNTRRALAIELISASQALDLRHGGRLGVGTQLAFDAVREVVPFMAQDVYLAPAINAADQLLASGQLRAAVGDVLPHAQM